VVVADENNRAPAEVQSALLEAVQKRQVTIGEATLPLPRRFFVLGTQNMREREGTYPVAEAQAERFMLKVVVGYPTRDEEKEILRRMAGGTPIGVDIVATPDEILRARRAIGSLYLDDKISDYIIDLVGATRDPRAFDLPDLVPLIEFGASPRATLALAACARAHAFLRGRGYVVPEDVKAVAPDVLRHRVIVTYEAEAEEVTSDEIVRRVLDAARTP
jgi:MoxR-like ATPase